MAVNSLVASFLGAPVAVGPIIDSLFRDSVDAVKDNAKKSSPHPVSPADPLTPCDLCALLGPRGLGDGVSFAIKDKWLGNDALAAIRAEVKGLDAAGSLRPAGMGRGDAAWVSADHRGDRILWLSSLLARSDGEPSASTSEAPASNPTIPALPALRGFVDAALKIQSQLMRVAPDLRLNGRISIQVACYPGNGARYVRHLDTTTDGSASIRRITLLYYLNPDWSEEADGGALRLYLPATDGLGEWYYDVYPHADRALVFLSDTVPHEVLPAHAMRYSLTVWMYGDAKPVIATPPQLPSVPVPVRSGVEVASKPSRSTDSAAREAPMLSADPESVPSAAPLLIDMDGDEESPPAIFVTMPCYRDPECGPTIHDLFAKAKLPDRVTVGVVWQIDEDEDGPSCLSHPILQERSFQIRSIRMDCRDAAGPVFARHLCMCMHRGEEYVLQIDSHMRFVQDWDEILLALLTACGGDKPVLTTYPPGYTLPNQVPTLQDTPVPLMCATSFGPEGFPRFTGRPLSSRPSSPVTSLFWAAGFSFSRAELFDEVSHDPSLKHIFFGEEVSFWCRAWCKGWRAFAPSVPVVYHLWSRAHRHTFREWSDARRVAAESKARAAILNGLLRCTCAVGDAVSEGDAHEGSCPRAFAAVVGLDFASKRVTPYASYGGLTKEAFS